MKLVIWNLFFQNNFSEWDLQNFLVSIVDMKVPGSICKRSPHVMSHVSSFPVNSLQIESHAMLPKNVESCLRVLGVSVYFFNRSRMQYAINMILSLEARFMQEKVIFTSWASLIKAWRISRCAIHKAVYSFVFKCSTLYLRCNIQTSDWTAVIYK